MDDFHYIPINFIKLVKGDSPQTIDIMDSIHQNIGLILSTSPGEYRFNRGFGCNIWERDFLNMKSKNMMSAEMEKEIMIAVKEFEKRLEDIKVKVNISEPEKKEEGINRKRKEIHITVEGILKLNKQNFKHQDLIYFSPLSKN